MAVFCLYIDLIYFCGSLEAYNQHEWNIVSSIPTWCKYRIYARSCEDSHNLDNVFFDDVVVVVIVIHIVITVVITITIIVIIVIINKIRLYVGETCLNKCILFKYAVQCIAIFG